MFNNTTSNIVSDKEAIRSNVLLLLQTERNSLFGDPYFGCELKKYIFEHSSHIVVDLLIDELYSAITTFIPQVFLTRKDIKIYTARTTIYAEISYTYVVDNTSDLFRIQLTDPNMED